MTAVDLPDLVKWVQKPAKSSPLEKLIRQTTDGTLRVTGGQMALFGKRAILAFGQDFAGGYFASNNVQTYTGQVRSFDIVDKHGGSSRSPTSAPIPPRPTSRASGGATTTSCRSSTM